MTTLELPYWHWRFRIGDAWRIQQQSNLFDLKNDVGEEGFRRRLNKNQSALFTLTPKDQQHQSPNVLTLVASLLPIKGKSMQTTEWLASQVQVLSFAYDDFKMDEPAHWMSEDKRWVKVGFSFANPGSESAQRVHSVFLGTIANGSGLIIALADPTGQQPFSEALLKSVIEMVNIPNR